MSRLSKLKGKAGRYATAGAVGGPLGLVGMGAYDLYHGQREKGQAKQMSEDERRKTNFALLNDSIDQGGSFDQILDRIRKGYTGDPRELPDFLEQNKAFLASGLLKTDAAKDLMDTGRFMGLTYAPGAGNIEQGALQGQQAAAGGLAMSGLSASGVSPALAMNTRLQAGAAKGNMYSNLMSSHLQSRFNLSQDVAGMALGFAPPARPQSMPTDYSGYAAGAGAIIGAAMPYMFPGGGGGNQAPRQGYKQAPTQGGGGLY